MISQTSAMSRGSTDPANDPPSGYPLVEPLTACETNSEALPEDNCASQYCSRRVTAALLELPVPLGHRTGASRCRPPSHTDQEVAGLTAAIPTGPNEIASQNVSPHFCAGTPRPAVVAQPGTGQRRKRVRWVVNLLRCLAPMTIPLPLARFASRAYSSRYRGWPVSLSAPACWSWRRAEAAVRCRLWLPRCGSPVSEPSCSPSA